MSHRDERKPGDLSIRFGFARVFGGGPDQGELRPSLSITDGPSGKSIEIELNPADLAELMSGSEVQVTAAAVSGFRALRDFGKRHEMSTRTAKSEPGDYRHLRDTNKVKALPHVAAMIADLEDAGYRCDLPRLNNAGMWTVVGRRYIEQ